jgi:hypothetical protein
VGITVLIGPRGRANQPGAGRVTTRKARHSELQNECLAAENRILRTKLPSRLWLSDPERAALAEIGKRLGPKAFRAVACVATALLRPPSEARRLRGRILSPHMRM